MLESTERWQKDRGYVFTKRTLCRRCDSPIPTGRRRTFCSADCVHEHKMRTQPSYARDQVFKRDHGICAECKTDTMEGSTIPAWKLGQGSGHRWQADHIRPVVEGGGEAGLDNYRTLCTPCHKKATAELRRRMANA